MARGKIGKSICGTSKMEFLDIEVSYVAVKRERTGKEIRRSEGSAESNYLSLKNVISLQSERISVPLQAAHSKYQT
jgi:hypothetical protein